MLRNFTTPLYLWMGLLLLSSSLSAQITKSVFSNNHVSAQQPTVENPAAPARTTFFAELGGPGVLFSANIDRRFTNSHLGWGGRIGIGFVSGYYDDYSDYSYGQKSILTVPIQINYVFGKGESPHTFEAGAGATILGKKIDVFDNYYNGGGTNVLGTASFLYRFQPAGGGLSWRIGFTPIIYSGYVQPFGGLGLGYAF
jgi:hypothetical protein